MDPPIFQAALLGTPLAFAWRFRRRDCAGLSRHRRWLSVTGLLIGSTAVLGHILLVTHIRRIGGIAADWSFLDWSRLLALLAIAAIPLSLFGRGKTRWLGASSPAMLIAFQFMAFWSL